MGRSCRKPEPEELPHRGNPEQSGHLKEFARRCPCPLGSRARHYGKGHQEGCEDGNKTCREPQEGQEDQGEDGCRPDGRKDGAEGRLEVLPDARGEAKDDASEAGKREGFEAAGKGRRKGWPELAGENKSYKLREDQEG